MISILQAMAPLAALFILHKILKATGLGSLTKMSGSIGMATQAALAATGDKAHQGFRKKADAAFDGAANKLGGKGAFGMTTKADIRSRQRKDIRKRARALAGEVGRGSRVAGKSRMESLEDASNAYRSTKSLAMKSEGVERIHRMRTLAAAGSAGRANREITRAALSAPSSLTEIGGHRMPGLRAPGARLDANGELVHAEQVARRLEIEKEMQGLPAGSPRRAALAIESAQLDSDLAIANTWGPEFVGEFIPERARLNAQAQYAEANGIDPSAVIVSSMGLPPQVAPVVGGFVAATTEVAAIAALSSFRNFLPDNQKVRLPVGDRLENDDEFSARLYHTGVAIGAIDPSTGQEVDWLALNGIDTSTVKGKQAAVDFMEGRSSPIASVAAIEMTAAVNARLNAVRRTITVPQAITAQQEITAAFTEQRAMFTQDQQVLGASAAAVAAAANPIASGLDEMTIFASAIYENPEFAKDAQASANQVLLRSEKQIHAMRQQVNDAIESQVRMMVELQVCDDTANGRTDRLTDDYINAQYQEQSKNAKAQAQAERNEVEAAFGKLQRQFNSDNAGGNNRKVDPAEVARLVKDVQDQVDKQRDRLASDAAGLAGLCTSEMDRAEKMKDQRLQAYARSNASSGSSHQRTASDVIGDINRS